MKTLTEIADELEQGLQNPNCLTNAATRIVLSRAVADLRALAVQPTLADASLVERAADALSGPSAWEARARALAPWPPASSRNSPRPPSSPPLERRGKSRAPSWAGGCTA